MIHLRNLEKSVKTKAGFTYLLRQINLDIAEGEFVTIMGPSGAGKSSLLSIIAKPALLLADEPTGNLHSEQGRQIMELFQKLNGQGMTIVQVTHSQTNAACGRRIIRLQDGWLVRE